MIFISPPDCTFLMFPLQLQLKPRNLFLHWHPQILRIVRTHSLSHSHYLRMTEIWHWQDTSVVSSACTAMNGAALISRSMFALITIALLWMMLFCMAFDVPLKTVADSRCWASRIYLTVRVHQFNVIPLIKAIQLTHCAHGRPALASQDIPLQ